MWTWLKLILIFRSAADFQSHYKCVLCLVSTSKGFANCPTWDDDWPPLLVHCHHTTKCFSLQSKIFHYLLIFMKVSLFSQQDHNMQKFYSYRSFVSTYIWYSIFCEFILGQLAQQRNSATDTLHSALSLLLLVGLLFAYFNPEGTN